MARSQDDRSRLHKRPVWLGAQCAVTLCGLGVARVSSKILVVHARICARSRVSHWPCKNAVGVTALEE